MRGRSQRTGENAPGGQRGIALISVLIMLFFFTSLGASLIALVFSRLNSAILEIDRLKAEYLAEAGMAKALYERTTGIDTDGNGIGNIALTYFGEGVFKVDHDPKGRSLLSQGVAHDVRRVSFIKYATQ